MGDVVRRIQIILNKLVSAELKAKSSKGFQHIKSRRVSCGSEHAFRLPIGMDYKKVYRTLGALMANLGTPVELENRLGVVIVRVVEHDFPKVMGFDAAHLGDKLLIGYNRFREPIYHPLNVHLLVAGASGAGKTDFLRWVMLQLLLQEYAVKVVDMKGFSFMPFDHHPGVEVATNIDAASKVLESAYKEMERRENLIKKTRDRSLTKEFQPLAVIIDEAAQIAPEQINDKEKKEVAKFCDEICARIAQKGREPRVFLFYCTQRPDRKVINPQVKANVEASIAFRTKTISNSMIILDRPGAEQIPVGAPGRCIYAGKEDYLLQVPYIGDDAAWETLLSEMLPYERSTRKNFNRIDPRSLGVYCSIGGAQSIAEPPQESIKVVQGVGARWTPNGNVARKGTVLETFQARPAAEEFYSDEIEEFDAYTGGRTTLL
ncbi:AAA family ATPase [Paenibacillus sp. TRM 82003]|nr:AAA family ATPase [Paenibacillus sp. TRM 82003]